MPPGLRDSITSLRVVNMIREKRYSLFNAVIIMLTIKAEIKTLVVE